MSVLLQRPAEALPAGGGGGPSTRKRLFVAAFPGLTQDAEQEPGWRNIALADWRLHCGLEVYPVHKAIVCRGPRASGFLAAACRSAELRKGGGGGGGLDGETDLSTVLPEPCWPVVPRILDFVYEGKFEADDAQGLLGLFVAADVLQIKALFERTLEALNGRFDWKVAPHFLAESAALKGSHPVVDQVSKAAQREVFQHFGRLLTEWGVPALVAKLGRFVSAEDLQELLDHDGLAAHEDQVFGFLREWTAQDGASSGEPSSSPWAVCRFAHLSPECLLAAARLEGLEKGLPPRIVSLSLALSRVLEEKGERECEKHCRAAAGVAPEGWLQTRRVKRRRAGLRKPVPGELLLYIHRSIRPDVSLETSELAGTTIRALKARLCAELGLDPGKVRIWDYFGRKPYALLDKNADKTLQARRIYDQNPIMLEEQSEGGGWLYEEED